MTKRVQSCAGRAMLALFLVTGAVWADDSAPVSGGTQDSPASPDAEKVEAVAEAKPVDEPVRFEQSLEVVTHAALIGEDALVGETIRETEIPDLGTALRSEPGLGAARRGPINLEPQVRGLVEGQLLVLVDGTRTFAAGPARMDSDLSHVGPRAVDRVRVVKGPYALSWGPGAFGAIDVETFAPALSDRSSWGALGGISYSDNGELGEVGATLWGSGPRWRYWLGHQQREGSDYESGGGVEIPGDFTSGETVWGIGWQASEASSLAYRGSHQAQDDIDYAGRLLDATFFRHDAHSLQLEWQSLAGESALASVSATLYSNEKSHRMNNDEKPTAQPMAGRMPPFALDVDLPTSSDTIGARVGADLETTGWAVRAGGDYFQVEQRADRFISRRDSGMLIFSDSVWPDAEIENTGLYLQATRPLDQGLLSGTVRFDSNQADAATPSTFFLEHAGSDIDQSGEDLSLALSGLWQLNDGFLLTAGAGRVVRYPTALERYSDRFPSTRFQVAAEFLGSPALDPEVAVQLDIGMLVTTARSRISVDLYHRSVDDYITVETATDVSRRLPLSPMTVYRYINGEGATFVGGEANWTLSIGDSWQVAVGASYLRGDDDTFDEPAFGVPPLNGSVALRWEPVDALTLGASVRWIDEQDRVATSRLEQATPGAEVVDLSAGWRFPQVELRGGVRNLFDEEYTDHLNTLNPFTRQRLAEPGRSLFLGLEFQL